MNAWDLVDRGMARLLAAASWLVLPVSLLLFLQWPLRDVLHRWSMQANDLAQWLFALYVALAVTQATRRRAHLVIEGMTHRFSPAQRRAVSAAGALLGVLPWAGFVLLAGFLPVWHSLRGWEAFPETGDPGYFLVKLAGLLLAACLAVQAVLVLRGKE